MRLSVLHLLLVAPAILALPSTSPDLKPLQIRNPSTPSTPSTASSSTFFSRLSSILIPQKRATSLLSRPLSGYEDEDLHVPQPPRALTSNTTAMASYEFEDEPGSSSSSSSSGSGGGSGSERVREKRASYPKCSASARGPASKKERTKSRTGFAHYPGWKLSGDDISGAVPVSPRSSCAQVCSKYGSACSGIYYDESRSDCFLKGTKTASWSFGASDLGSDGTDLAGGCAAWSSFVPPEMDDVCCRE